MPKITRIIDPSFKSGISAKTSKPWTLMKVETDNGEEATMFAPAKEGDEVTLTYNADYKNYNAELVKPKTQASAQLDRIEAKLDQLLAGASGITASSPPSDPAVTPLTPNVGQSPAPASDQPPLENYDAPY